MTDLAIKAHKVLHASGELYETEGGFLCARIAFAGQYFRALHTSTTYDEGNITVELEPDHAIGYPVTVTIHEGCYPLNGMEVIVTPENGETRILLIPLHMLERA